MTATDQLHGVQVLDLGIWRPAPYATQLLAELGAEVTKVEPPGGDPMRAFPSLYRSLNARKAVRELDLRSDAGRAEVAGLLAAADVVVEGFRPGVADRLGVGPVQARAANPGVIHCSISGFGQDGPLAAAPGHDLNFQAWAGVLGGPGAAADRTPGGLPVADLAGGTFAALAVCAALARRGRVEASAWAGERIDVSMADVLLSWAAPAVDGALTGSPSSDSPSSDSPSGSGSAGHPSSRFPGYGSFACADGAVVLGVVTEDPFWRSLCDGLGLGELAPLDAAERAGDGPALRARLAAALAGRRRDDVVGELLARGVPVAPVLSPAEALAVDHFAARGTVVDGAAGHPVRFGTA